MCVFLWIKKYKISDYFKSRRKIFGLTAAFVRGGCGFLRVFVFWVRVRLDPSCVGRWSKAQGDEVGRYYATVGREAVLSRQLRWHFAYAADAPSPSALGWHLSQFNGRVCPDMGKARNYDMCLKSWTAVIVDKKSGIVSIINSKRKPRCEFTAGEFLYCRFSLCV